MLKAFIVDALAEEGITKFSNGGIVKPDDLVAEQTKALLPGKRWVAPEKTTT